jgi:uncharacterized membrane-anchored protein
MGGAPTWGQPTGMGVGLEAARAQIQESVRARPQTDKILSPLWILAPVLGIVVALSLIVLAFFIDPALVLGLIVAALFVPAIIFAVILYYLINRMTDHFVRESNLRRGVIQYLRAKAEQEGKGPSIASEIATMQSVHAEADASDGQKPAVLWTILAVVVPIVGLYVLYFLTKYPYEHDARWRAFSQQVQAAGSKLGLITVAPSWKSIEKRSFFVYLILTVLTAGTFALYWYYVLIQDPNQHFRAQAQFEDVFLAAIGGGGWAPPPGPGAPPTTGETVLRSRQ